MSAVIAPHKKKIIETDLIILGDKKNLFDWCISLQCDKTRELKRVLSRMKTIKRNEVSWEFRSLDKTWIGGGVPTAAVIGTRRSLISFIVRFYRTGLRDIN